jgi:hypothetical protein
MHGIPPSRRLGTPGTPGALVTVTFNVSIDIVKIDPPATIEATMPATQSAWVDTSRRWQPASVESMSPQAPEPRHQHGQSTGNARCPFARRAKCGGYFG